MDGRGSLVTTPPLGTRIEVSRSRPTSAERLLAASRLLDGAGSVRRLCWEGATGRRRLRRLTLELAEWWPDRVRDELLLVWRISGEGIEGRLEVGGFSIDRSPPSLVAGRLGPGLSPDLEIGTTAIRHVPVDDTNATDHLADGRRLLTTPDMIGQMEHTGAELLRPFLLGGFGALGAHNEITHSRPAFFGETVRYQALLVGVNGSRLVYAVSAAVGSRIVGHGRHESHIVRLNTGGGST